MVQSNEFCIRFFVKLFFTFKPAIATISITVVHPLVTHDPNMFKKVTGELTRERKSVSSRRGNNKFPVETIHTITRGL